MQFLPWKTEASQWRMQIALSGVLFYLSFRWNALNEYWIMTLSNANNEALIDGVKLVTNWDLLEQYSFDGRPMGRLLCQNIIGGEGKIGRSDMGVTTQLVYYEAGELETLAVEAS